MPAMPQTFLQEVGFQCIERGRHAHITLPEGFQRQDNARRIQCLLHPIHAPRSEEHTSELQSLMRISYAVFCLKKKTYLNITDKNRTPIEKFGHPLNLHDRYKHTAGKYTNTSHTTDHIPLY